MRPTIPTRTTLRLATATSLLLLVQCTSAPSRHGSPPTDASAGGSQDGSLRDATQDSAAPDAPADSGPPPAGDSGAPSNDGGADAPDGAPSDAASHTDAPYDAATSPGSFTGQYYSNPTLSGSPVLTRTDDAINFRFGYGDPGVPASPDPSVPSVSWSAEWDGQWTFPTGGSYKFYATTTNGVRVYVDGNAVIDSWMDQAETSYVAPLTLSAGVHDIRVQYYTDSTQAVVIVSWAMAPDALLALEKQGGCYADGVLWGGPDEAFGRSGDPDLADLQSTVASSSCTFLLRAGETWFIPPDYATVQTRMSALQALAGNKRFVYGLYVSEALLPNADSYTDPLTGQTFGNSDFAQMCVPGSTGTYGLTTDCASSLRMQQYQTYVASLTERGLDLGFTDFLFGALPTQESVAWNDGGADTTWETSPIFPKVFAALRAYAFARGVTITIGCQMVPPAAFDYTEYTHLALCDYKYSPLLTSVVTATTWPPTQWDDPASAGWSSGDWNTPAITSKTAVLADFENWGTTDDPDLYAEQQKPDRDAFVFNAYAMLKAAGQGLLMPFFEPLSAPSKAQCLYPSEPGDSGAMYSPSDKYCGDEEAMNAAMGGSPIYITADLHYVQSGGSTTIRWYTPTPNTCGVWANGYELWLNGDYGGTATYGLLTADTVYTLECPDGSTAQTTVHVQ